MKHFCTNILDKKHINTLVTLLITLLYIGAIVWWHIYTPDYQITIQNPGADNRPEGKTRSAEDVVIGEYFMRYAQSAPSLTGQWPCFRGNDAQNRAKTDKALDFVPDFQVLWKAETGEGHAAPVIYNGLVYLLDYDEKLHADMLRCFDLQSGTELWRRWYRVPMKRNHGFSRTAPAVTDKFVVTMGPLAHLMCCDRITGEMRWRVDVRQQFDSEEPFWYSGQCPRIEDNVLIIAPAGKEVLMAGIDCETGEIVWQTPNTVGYTMSHSSVMPMTLGGKKMYVYAGIGGVCGVSAEAADRGALLWSVSTWKPSVIAPSPLQLSSNEIALTAGYGAGGALLQVKYAEGKWIATIVDHYKPNEGLSSEQQTPILYEKMLITIPPKDGGGIRGKLVAYSPSNVRAPIWESASDERFGSGPYMIIGAHLLALKDDGELYVYKLEPQSMTLVKKQRIVEGSDAWGPMAYADGYLMMRDADAIYCLQIDG